MTGIIDGTGSLGAAVGQLIIGYVQQAYGWNSVFVVMTFMVFISIIPLLRNFVNEFKEIKEIRRINREKEELDR